MNISEFDKLMRTVISPVLVGEEGFSLRNGTFFKDLPNQVRQVVMFDFDARTKKTFRIILGFNSPVIAESLPPYEAGVFGVRYLSGSHLSDTPSNFPCFDRSSALRSLEIVKRSLVEAALPWIASANSMEKLAEIAEAQYPFVKGKLYLYAGLAGQARVYLSNHLTYLLRQVKTLEVTQGITDTQELLDRCL